MRLQAAERYQVEFQPTEESIRVMHDVLESNPYWSTLRSWADDPTVRTARLVLRWPGTTPGVRAFTYQPNVGTPGPRTIYVTRVDESDVGDDEQPENRLGPESKRNAPSRVLRENPCAHPPITSCDSHTVTPYP